MPLQPAAYFIQIISAKSPLAMLKPGCPFCIASKSLIKALADTGIITNFLIVTLGTDFDNETLLEVSSHFGWQSEGYKNYPSKPQVFIDGEYIGGNSEFYQSKWNVGAGMPKLQNPM